MAKRNLKFDAGKLNDFCEIWHEVVDDNSPSPRPVPTLLFSPRCYIKVSTRTNQAQLQSGSFDLYQVFEFIIRYNPNYTIQKDMYIISSGKKYVVRAVITLENNPLYIKIITETTL